jgi:hypothetical protein
MCRFFFANRTLALKETPNSTKHPKKNENYNEIFEKSFIFNLQTVSTARRRCRSSLSRLDVVGCERALSLDHLKLLMNTWIAYFAMHGQKNYKLGWNLVINFGERAMAIKRMIIMHWIIAPTPDGYVVHDHTIICDLPHMIY